MTIFNFGSINVDHFYALPHLPRPGETLGATQYSIGLGGKGLNQSVAVARAGCQVHHIGAIGASDTWVREKIEYHGVNCQYVASLDVQTGHAIILVDSVGENSIVLYEGANTKIDHSQMKAALSTAKMGDILLVQNETNMVVEAAQYAHNLGLRVFYSAAPFDVKNVKEILPFVSVLLVNEVEADQLCAALGSKIEEIPVPEILVTMGSKGALLRSNQTGEVIEVSSPKVVAVDTTAAGDTFAGYFAAGCDLGLPKQQSLVWAASAAALKVTKRGTAEAIPTADAVTHFQNGSTQ
ncbi:ribokinase [Pacificibacter maritimus]|uniref:Ribokinase n=1 Tax=Pacificibacter maritimus TaxID=762213 RepID=A0A3N4U8N0_9RHOB|nr:ribokinase [Pacificibacter maritimus]RPE64705.1 ribokinase [Pacificibacter maritimus]